VGGHGRHFDAILIAEGKCALFTAPSHLLVLCTHIQVSWTRCSTLSSCTAPPSSKTARTTRHTQARRQQVERTTALLSICLTLDSQLFANWSLENFFQSFLLLYCPSMSFSCVSRTHVQATAASCSQMCLWPLSSALARRRSCLI